MNLNLKTMKKRITKLIIVALLFFSLPSNSQITNSYIDSTSTWYELSGSFDGFNIYVTHSKYYIDGDTLLMGNNYYKVYIDQIDSIWDFFTNNFTSTITSNHYYMGGLREDSLKRFYFFYMTQNAELLLFDFNVTLGDTLPDMESNYGCNIPPDTVTAIDTVYLGTQPVRHFSLSSYWKSMYEGIGSSGGFIQSGSLCQFIESGACLIAYTRGLDSLYINCGAATTGIFNISKTDHLMISPNPAFDHFTIRNESASQITFQLFDTFGKKVIELSTKNVSTLISADKLISGLYLWRISDTKDSVRSGKLIIAK